MAGPSISLVNFEGAAALLRAGRCIVSSMKYINEDAAVRFCQIFDAAAAADVTVGTTVPVWVLTAGANGGDDDYMGNGIVFTSGIVVAGTTTPDGSTAAADNTQHIWAVIE